ncbi:hypothetical protein TNCV_4074471 [Trichonephila clavipes]|uniref:Transposase Tc1-like domain-containing protein n=1 Tax=Trichonephila clavipes TaxID=2585209 RepID=A0A8X6W933_TRICX|nr:hypothetical protein TNCV_4074471 [Trichonephila clavipes]
MVWYMCSWHHMGTLIHLDTTLTGVTAGQSTHHSTHVPLLTARHKALRFVWARQHRHWTFDEWKDAIWSHKTRFRLNRADGRIRIDHLIGASAHAPQRPMVTYNEMGTAGLGTHGLLSP